MSFIDISLPSVAKKEFRFQNSVLLQKVWKHLSCLTLDVLERSDLQKSVLYKPAEISIPLPKFIFATAKQNIAISDEQRRKIIKQLPLMFSFMLY